MKTEKITFTNSKGISLAARIDRPEQGEAAAYVLASHCFTCTKDIPALHHITTALVDRGLGVMRFDFTGLGNSGGDFIDSGFKDNLDDIRSAVAYLSERGMGPHILFGHSLGGTAMLVVAREVPSAIVVATMGSPFYPKHALHLTTDAHTELKASGATTLNIANVRYQITRAFVDQSEDFPMKEIVHAIHSHLIVFQDPEDDTVEVDNARLIFEAARHPKSFISLPKAGHLLNRNRKDADFVAGILAITASRYLALKTAS